MLLSLNVNIQIMEAIFFKDSVSIFFNLKSRPFIYLKKLNSIFLTSVFMGIVLIPKIDSYESWK